MTIARHVMIARLNPTNAAAYRALMLAGYKKHPDAFTSTVEERPGLPVAWWEARLDPAADAAEVVIGAFDADQLAGAVGMAFECRLRLRHRALIFGIYVDERFHGQGLGSGLLTEALDQARERGARTAHLTVTEGNAPAEALYRGHGFHVFGVDPLAVQLEAGFVSRVHMWCDLDEAATGKGQDHRWRMNLRRPRRVDQCRGSPDGDQTPSGGRPVSIGGGSSLAESLPARSEATCP